MLKAISFIAIMIILSQAGCAFEPIKPWERGTLARENMSLEADSIIQLMDEQIYYSKEASSGGKGVGGGGCGCN